ncbi:MAG: hypothetical protein WC728_00665 [Elusimicrobiota bacterium]
MRLLIDPDPPRLRWSKDAVETGGVPLGEASSISYRLHHGGERLREPATRVTPESLAAVRSVIRYRPEHNSLTYEAACRMLRLLPDVPQFFLCDTAFFSSLPEEASVYAVPSALRSRGVRRYGGNGLHHRWAWQRTRELCGQGVSRVISIRLGDRSDVAALRDGAPVDTTLGFSPVEGLLSRTGCGDIDASVVFELRTAGLSLSEINDLLSRRSGFRALVGPRCGFKELSAPSGGADRALAREMLLYGVVKCAGGFAALLGGADVVAIAAESPSASTRFVWELCRRLGALGLGCRRRMPLKDGAVLSDRGSAVKAVFLEADLWRSMAWQAAVAEKEG